MADIVVRAPDGSIVEVPEAEYQKALNAGYQNVSQEEADAARAEFVSSQGEAAATAAGVLQLDPDAAYSPVQEFLAKGVSAATFGLGGLNDPASQLTAQRFQAEHPVVAVGAEVAGQLPLALVAGGAAATAGTAGLARAGTVAADFAAQAAIGGAQTEAELARVEGRDFSATNAAVVGVIGEAFGRTAGLGFSAALGARRNLIARAERRAVAQDTADALSRGGFLNDFRVAAHAEQYQNELAKLAADDLDALETSFAEVSRQDRKRARITRVVEDRPAEQAAVRQETLAEMRGLYEALWAEIGDGSAPAPARAMLNQLRERMDLLAERPSGARLWRLLDENRQALQDYAQDLHQAYENAPGSAWLSRDALARLDATERVTRETLLREDVWGPQAAREQAAYNVPFHEKYFPTVKTVRGKLMFSTATDARGFPVYRGDPGRVLSFFRRAEGDVDSSRLAEQFTEYLDGVEAIARASERDTPRASRDALEAVRRLRKATAHAEFIAQTAARMGRRADVAEVGAGVAAGVAGAASGGLAGAAAGGLAGQTVRGLRLVHWLSQAARKLGWAGSPESMAAMLAKGELPRRFGPDTPTDVIDDVVVPGRPSEPPPSGAPPAGPGAPETPPGGGGGPETPPAGPGAPGGAGGGGRGLTPSMLADARRGSWAPSESPPTSTDAPSALPMDEELTLEQVLALVGRESRAERAARETVPVEGRLVGRGQLEAEELDPLREAGLAGRREARRLEALTEGEFRDVVRQLDSAADENPQAEDLARKLRGSLDALKTAGLVIDAGAAGAAAAEGDAAAGAAAAGLGLVGLGLRRGPSSAVGWARQLGLPDAAVVDGQNVMFQRIGNAQGSNPGGWYQSPGGLKFYVKTYADPQQAVAENAANAVYQLASNTPAPRSRLITTPEGELAYASSDADGWKPKPLAEVTAEEAADFANGFWVDVLLANWDVVGQSGDNLLFDGTGRVMRLDNGSSLEFRAQGARKPPGALTTLSEIDGFFNRELNPNYAELLAKAGVSSPKDLRAQLTHLITDFSDGVLFGRLDEVLPADQSSLIWQRFELLQRVEQQLESPIERFLRENLGTSQQLGAMFHGRDAAALDVVEAARARLQPPPPVEVPIITPWLEDAGTPELTRLVRESARVAQGLNEAEREALAEWVGSSMSIRSFAKTGAEPPAHSWKTLHDKKRAAVQAAAFEAAAEKLTIVNPTKHGTLYRHLDLPDRGLAELLSRDEFVVSAPTSTAYIPDSNFGAVQLRFERVDRAAALIGYNPSEAEMLLLPGSRFRKTGEYYDEATGNFTFTFEEVPETTKSPAWGDLGHLSLGPMAFSAAAAAAEAAASGQPVATEDGVVPPAAAAAGGFTAAAALFNRTSARLVANAAKRLFSLTAEPVAKATARLAYSRTQLERRRDELAQWHQNPDAPGGVIDRLAEGLRDAPPDAFASTSAAAYRALNFLRERLPQSGRAAPVAANRGLPVSDEAAAKYARYEQAALYPGDAIREASESGYLSSELLETLEELYPELLAELRVAAYQAVQDAGPRQLSVQAKTQYARLFDGRGELADPTFSAQATTVYAAAYEQATASISLPKTGAGPRPGVSQTAAAVAAPQPWRTGPA